MSKFNRESVSVQNQHRQTHRRPIWKTLVLATPVVISLLSFPSVLTTMVAFWLIWSCWRFFSSQPGVVPLLACLGVLAAKLVALTPAMSVFLVTLVAVAVFRWFAGRSQSNQTKTSFGRLIAAVAVLWSAWGLMAIERSRSENVDTIRLYETGRPIVCIGDSLTDGMLPDHGFPAALQKMVNVPVINLGVSGISASQGRDQMARVVSHRPQVVVIELGGHDFLRGHSRSETKATLVDMIQQSKAAGADVILMEIPRGFIFDPFRSLEREIANEHDVQLVSDTWLREIVIRSPIVPPAKWYPAWQLSDDGIHSNPKGSHRIALRVCEALEHMYGPSLFHDDSIASF